MYSSDRACILAQSWKRGGYLLSKQSSLALAVHIFEVYITTHVHTQTHTHRRLHGTRHVHRPGPKSCITRANTDAARKRRDLGGYIDNAIAMQFEIQAVIPKHTHIVNRQSCPSIPRRYSTRRRPAQTKPVIFLNQLPRFTVPPAPSAAGLPSHVLTGGSAYTSP